MRCEICGKDVGQLSVELPIKKADGSLNTRACLKCAEESSVYCKKHRRPHLGFIDDTTACIVCIKELVAKNRKQKEGIYRSLRQNLPEEEFKRIIEWARVSSSLTGDPIRTCILRAIATRAMRSKQDITSVLDKILQDKSVECILPLEE